MEKTKELVLVKYGEIILKGLNRPIFEEILISNIRNGLKNFNCKVRIAQATIYVTPENCDDIDAIMSILKNIFGIVSITRVAICEKNMADISRIALDYCREKLITVKTFKVESKRSDKKFHLNSQQISAEVGGYIYEAIDGLEVDVKTPDVIVTVEVRDFGAYVHYEKTKGQGGLPTGTGGKSTLLLSGGIDSPVAGYMMAKRGLTIEAVNFFSHPYTSERAKEKVIDLAKILARYTGKVRLYIVPFTDIQLEIREKCKEDFMTLLMRRFMMRISEKIALNNGSKALITGESFGQVASQTLEALHVTNAVCTIPVFQPVIGMDKEEIVEISRKIGAFETSILPYEDCCTVFTPKHPATKPKLHVIENSEKLLDVEALIEQAISGIEILDIFPDKGV